MNDEKIETSRSLLIPTTLLHSVAYILKDCLLHESNSDIVTHEDEIVGIIAKIEVSLEQIKERIEKKDYSLKQRVSNGINDAKHSEYPPPPFTNEQFGSELGKSNNRVSNLEDVAEEASSTSTMSAERKDNVDKEHCRKLEHNQDETLSPELTSSTGPLHSRRKSRRLSQPFLSNEKPNVST